MIKKPFEIQSAAGAPIYGDARIPEFPEGKPLIVFCHGFKGFKDWGGWNYALDKMASAGFFVISMNFSHNGVGRNLLNFEELNRFSVNTIGKELLDLESLLSAVASGSLIPEIGKNYKAGLIGHSRAGGTIILHAAQKRNVNALVTWAGVGNFENYLKQAGSWRDKGYIEMENKRTSQIMRMNTDFLNDLEGNAAQRDLIIAESTHNLPHLILHGDHDEAVPIEQPNALYEASNKAITKFETLNGANHTFGTVHPFNGTTAHFDALIFSTTEWFRKFLN